MRRFDLKTLHRLPATGKWQELRDVVTPGLVLRIAPSGVRSFSWRRRVNGKLVRVHLGGIADFTWIEDVRREAEKLNLTYRQGKDPAEQHRRGRQPGLTFGALFERWVEEKAKPKLRAWRKNERWYDLYLSVWKLRPLASLTASDAKTLLKAITDKGSPIAANSVRALASSVFNWARREADPPVEVDNPFRDTKPNDETAKTRNLSPGEVNRFWQALQAEPDGEVRDFFMLLLLTGARGHMLASARWSDIDLREALWRVPSTVMKAKRPFDLPLAHQVVAILADRRQFLPSDTPWVFPSRQIEGRHRRGVPIEGWLRVLKAAELTGITVHDLRRSFASRALDAGIPREIIGRILGHSTGGTVTDTYSRASLTLARWGVDRACAVILRMAEAASAEDADKVLDLQRPPWAAEP